jgi:thioredoxin 1
LYRNIQRNEYCFRRDRIGFERRYGMSVRKISGNEIATVTTGNDKLSLVDFSATWCGPCKMLHPVLDKVSDELSDTIDFFEVDVDECQQEAARFGIRGVPTLVVFRGGSEIDRLVGFRDKAALTEHLKGLADTHLGG